MKNILYMDQQYSLTPSLAT